MSNYPYQGWLYIGYSMVAFMFYLNFNKIVIHICNNVSFIVLLLQLNCKNKLRTLITFLIISSISALSAQDKCFLTVGGKITDSHDSEGLSFASIYITETRQFAFTDDQGMWKIENVCPGNFHLKIVNFILSEY
jgi:hypothetical protein